MERPCKELILFGHSCPNCFPKQKTMCRTSKSVNILICEICGFRIDDRKIRFNRIPIEEIAKNYLTLFRQILLNTKADYIKYKSIQDREGIKGKRRAEKELKDIDIWIEKSKLLGFIALIANRDVGYFRENVDKEIKNSKGYKWEYLFRERV